MISKDCDCGTGRQPPAPPENSQPAVIQNPLELKYVNEDEFLMAL